VPEGFNSQNKTVASELQRGYEQWLVGVCIVNSELSGALWMIQRTRQTRSPILGARLIKDYLEAPKDKEEVSLDVLSSFFCSFFGGRCHSPLLETRQ
jgi:hypothetical protein